MYQPNFMDYDRVVRRARRARSMALGAFLAAVFRGLKPRRFFGAGPRPAH